ncbi:MAG: MafI family immunity protein [Microthrixaceae bacterium]
MLELRLRALLASLAVHVEAWVVEEPTALLDAGEWGVAFESLCDNLYDGEISVFPGEVAEIESLGTELGSTRRAWRLVRELVIGDEGSRGGVGSDG